MAKKPPPPPPGDNSVAQLQGIIERIEKLLEERAILGDDIKEIFVEAKSAGFDKKAIRNVIRIRKVEPETFAEEIAMTNIYLRAMNMPEVDLSAASDL